MNNTPRVYVAGHRGLVGSAICRRLRGDGIEPITRTHSEVDLSDAAAVDRFFADTRPTHIYMAAAKVGGIVANNDFPVDFSRENVLIQTNVFDAAHKYDAEKLLFLGSSCIYPRECPQPIKEEYLLTAPLEPTNEPYALAKILGVRMCQAYRKQFGRNFISVMPTNMYGPNDNYHPDHSHVIPGLIRRIHEAKVDGDASVAIWGTGNPKREFMHVDDLADACLFLMDEYSEPEHINVGWGRDVSIAELAQLIADVVGFEGELEFDTSQPDGTPRKLLDTSKINALGWNPRIELRAGLESTYETFVAEVAGAVPS